MTRAFKSSVTVAPPRAVGVDTAPRHPPASMMQPQVCVSSSYQGEILQILASVTQNKFFIC
jgi:hypothetical protein